MWLSEHKHPTALVEALETACLRQLQAPDLVAPLVGPELIGLAVEPSRCLDNPVEVEEQAVENATCCCGPPVGSDVSAQRALPATPSLPRVELAAQSRPAVLLRVAWRNYHWAAVKVA